MKSATLKLPEIQKSVPEVFIIESLDFEDEEMGRYEGAILSEILRMCGKAPKYYYFRTKTELKELITLFRNSSYRYLHVSMHGCDTSVDTTLETISYGEFAALFSGHLKNRRLFLSACSTGNPTFARALREKNKGMYSIAAPTNDIEFRHAAALWGAFYVRLFSVDSDGMKSREINFALTQMCGLFDIQFFWTWYDAKNDEWKEMILERRQA